MLTVYGALMPLRLLEEIRFWKMQEKEHTVVIRELVPNLEPEYVKVLEKWEPIFAKTEHEAVQWTEAVLRSPAGITPYIQMQIEGLLQASIKQSNAFISQLAYMAAHSRAVKAYPTAPVVINHIIRESEYFLGVLQAFLSQGPALPHSAAPYAAGGSGLAQSFSSAAFLPYRQESPKDGRQQLRTHELRQSDQPQQLPRPGVSPAATGEGTWSDPLAAGLKPVPIGGHTLPPLPYGYDALEPYIDQETMRLHHDKHHQTYVDGLNNAEKKLAEARKTGDFSLVKHWERELAFHGAGHYLHTIFWNVMAPKAGGSPSGLAAEQIKRDFGGFDAFKKQFSEAADKVEGGGWAIWVFSPRSHRTEILIAEKHQNLSQWDVVPLLPLDVWEHAYYLKYQNKRPDYIKAWWNTVNWKHVNDRLTAARQLAWPPY
jgi:superoxide dismutase, Fe-Mn family